MEILIKPILLSKFRILISEYYGTTQYILFSV